MKLNWLSYFQLGRMGMAPLTMSVPIFGLLTAVSNPSASQLVYLGLIGLYAHLFGFALNDMIDYPIDKESPYRQKSPLVKGNLLLRQAWRFVLIQPLFVAFIYVVLLRGTAVGLFALILSFVLSIIYNLWSKTGQFPRILAELALALSVGLLCLMGALSQQITVPQHTMLFALTLTLISLLVNSVPSGLKDIKADQAVGGRSFVLSVGCFVIAGDQLYISPKLRAFGMMLQLAIVCALIGTANQFAVSMLVKSIVLFSVLVSTLHLINLLRIRSYDKLRRSGPLLSGFCNYLALILILVPSLSIHLQVGLGFTIVLIMFLSRLTYWSRRRKRHKALASLGG